MNDSMRGRRGRGRGGRARWSVLAVVVLGVVAQPAETGPKSADDAVEIAFEGTCTEHEAGFIDVFDLELSGGRVVGLFGTGLGERYLTVLATVEAGFERVEKGVDGFAVGDEHVLAWRSDPGRLLVLPARDPARQVASWRGSVARVEAAEPRIAGGRVWWLTEVEGELRAACSDLGAAAEDFGTPRLSPPLPVTEAFSMAFSAGAALLQTTDLERSWLWRGDGPWRPLGSTPALRVVDAVGASFVAWDVEAEQLRVAEDAPSGLEWRRLFAPDSVVAPTNETRFYAAEDGLRATFVEVDGPRAKRLTHLGPGSRVRVVSVDREPLRVAFDGRSRAVLRHRTEGLFELELCGKQPVTVARAVTTAVPTAVPATSPETPNATPGRGSEIPRAASARPVGLSLAGIRALTWMHNQLGPMLELDNGRQGRLIDSYEDDQRAGWVYDAALAVIVFSASGRQDLARQLLVGLESLQHSDGSWSFAFHPDRGRVIEKDRYVGSIAWVVMAVNFYEWQTRDGSFSEMARAGLGFIERFQSKDPSASEFGGVAMGPGRRQEYSAEHNADSYSAFFWRARLEKDGRLMRTAGQIRRFILATLWTEYSDGESRRYFKIGARDRSLYLDPQTWLTLSLGAGADEPSARALSEGLRLAERHLEVRRGLLVGFNEGKGPDIGRKIWPEGTEGMVAALRVVGRHDQADFYHRQTAELQTPSGGIPYATENSDGWSTKPAVASTAWFLLNEYACNPFRPAERTMASAAETEGADDDRRVK